MTSEPTEAYVWVWLPGHREPVVAGRIETAGAGQRLVQFVYGQSYLARPEAIALYLPDLPLRTGLHEPRNQLSIPGGVADSMPDLWGRQVVMYRRFGAASIGLDTNILNPVTYLLESSPNRIGALAFSASPTECETGARRATLAELMTAASSLANKTDLTPELAEALLHGSSVGGAWPKALVVDGERQMIAKFATRTGNETALKTEFVAMRLAKLAGLDVAAVELVEVLDKPVLLIDRFDRDGQCRRAMVSALTILGHDENAARYCTYFDLATQIRFRFADGRTDAQELFRRIVFNILVGNTDDHAKNHAAFWDGQTLRLTPAYDIAPQLRAGGEAQQAMAIGKDGFRYSNVPGALRYARDYLLTEHEAADIVAEQVAAIEDNWAAVVGQAAMTEPEADSAWRRQFLNPYAFYDID